MALNSEIATSEPAQPQPQPQPAPLARRRFIGFVADAASAALLHEVMEPALPKGNEFHVVGFRSAIGLLGSMRTPEIVLIDLTGEAQPLNAMLDLADVVEAGTTVLALGESRDLSFYRAVTRGMGVREYLQKPLSREKVAAHFLPWVRPERPAPAVQRGGRLIAVGGVRGGVGCTTVAANLAWLIGSEMRRHTVLLDADLHTGTAALTLNVQVTSGLKTALEAPERIDQLLIERASQPAGERLHVLAALEPLDSLVNYREGSAAMLCDALQQRYKFALADTGRAREPFARELQYLAQQKVVVMTPDTLSLRNFNRMSRRPHGPDQSPRPILVLNYAGRHGAMSQADMEEALGEVFTAVIPELPRVLPRAALLGEPAAALKGPFREAILRIAKAVGAGQRA